MAQHSLLAQIEHVAGDPAYESAFRAYVAEAVASIGAPGKVDARALVADVEGIVRSDPAGAFRLAVDGTAVLDAAGEVWGAGRVETPSIGELRRRADATGDRQQGAELKLILMAGAHAVTDIGALQAWGAESALFQVASQFDCLESPAPRITRVANYFHDPTQGPRASISAFPATLLRHYFAPGSGGQRYVQVNDGKQIDLLADAFGRHVCRNGYFTGQGLDPAEVLERLTSHFDSIRVGVHDDVQVVLGGNWDRAVPPDAARISQVFTSTAAGGGYGAEAHLARSFRDISRQLLHAAYTGTLLAAVTLRRRYAVLTLIGGGVFGNEIEDIWAAIIAACDELVPLLDLTVVVNGYALRPTSKMVTDVRERNGAVIHFDGGVRVER